MIHELRISASWQDKGRKGTKVHLAGLSQEYDVAFRGHREMRDFADDWTKFYQMYDKQMIRVYIGN